MSATIEVLPSRVIDRIAAGEVVERPASVVKELVENSLDAGASNVGVYLTDGGLGEIRVLDDGAGMGPDDAARCLLRHATSKIRSDDDLLAVRTLGFRGEALASIASVSDFFLETGRGLDAPGCHVELDGDVPRVNDAPPRKGTLIVARDLFGSVPARRKFLKTPRTEISRVQEVVLRAALARPEAGFRLESDGRTLLDSKPCTSLKERVRQVLGRAPSERMFEVRGAGEIGVAGWLAPPKDALASARRLHVILDGRPVKDSALVAAVRQGYGPLLDRGKTPPGVVALTLPPDAVDVNVHPAKTEVRFADPSAVFRAVLVAVRAAVARTPWMTDEPPRSAAAALTDDRPAPAPTPQLRPWQRGRAPEGQNALPIAREPTHSPAHATLVAPDAPPRSDSSPPPPSPAGRFSDLRYLGQVARLFLVLDDGEGLVLVDQHAAHERVLFERIRATAGALEVQPLLFPALIECSPSEVRQAEAHAEALAAYGLELDAGGPDELVLRGVPAMLRHADFGTLVRGILADLSEGAESPTAEHRLELTWATLACHAAVRAGDPMKEPEVRALLRDMDTTDLGTYCPHGRPVVARLAYDEIARLFDR